MEDPKRQAWMYLVAGVVAVVAALYFLSTDAQSSGNLNILDWGILGMGIVATYRGVKGFIDLRRGEAKPAAPTKPAGPTKLARPDARKPASGDQKPKDAS